MTSVLPAPDSPNATVTGQKPESQPGSPRRAETDPGLGQQKTNWFHKSGDDPESDDDADKVEALKVKVHDYLEKTAFRRDSEDSTKDKDKLQKPTLPARQNGYTIKVTFHNAVNLPAGDLATFMSDPYVVAEAITGLPQRDKEDPPLQFRTRTIHRTLNPTWNESWTVANIPGKNLRLKFRLYDEDYPDVDDRLGNANFTADNVDENWEGADHVEVDVKGNGRTPTVKAFHPILSRLRGETSRSYLVISVKVLRRTGEEDGVGPNEGSRAFTVGPTWMRRHHSPLLGMILGIKDSIRGPDAPIPGEVQKKYNFPAHEFQLAGPVPIEMYHRFVAYRPTVALMFAHRSFAGYLVGGAMHRQHRRMYNFDHTTVYKRFDEPTTKATDSTAWLLNSAHFGRGGRLFTYVILLDGVMKFTETGGEFAVQGLSKHALHSDVSPHIAFSGEFFIRRSDTGSDITRKIMDKSVVIDLSDAADSGGLNDVDPRLPDLPKWKFKHLAKPQAGNAANQDRPATAPARPTQIEGSGVAVTDTASDGDGDGASSGGSAENKIDKITIQDVNPADYELVIDNESGTYQPAGSLLPELKRLLERTFPGLKVTTFDGQTQADELKELKAEQERLKEEARKMAGKKYIYLQNRDSDEGLNESEVKHLRRLAAADRKKGTDKGKVVVNE